jgi:8-oxo-dGTP diphosphatase
VSLVRAAGGVVTREGPSGLEVALVHRPAYDDWSFPKGKLEPGEDELTCALREVREEAGLVCEAREDLGAITYVDGRDRPKVVRYWHMTADAGAEVVAAHEIDDARWVSLAEAEPMLTYVHDRTLLRRLHGDPPTGEPTPVFLVRHAKAGERGSAGGPDELRPLSRTGRKQAVKLAATLAPLGVRRLASSPALRCIQTLEPLSEHLGIDIAMAPELFEGNDPAGAEAWVLAAAADGPAALCTHGDLTFGLIAALKGRGVPIGGDGTGGNAKAAAWRLDVWDGRIRKMTYVPAPSGPRPPPESGFII